MLKDTIKNLLLQIISNIDAGNSNITEEEGLRIINYLNCISSPLISKYEACRILNVSRATFDRFVAKGELPKGLKRTGFNELAWRLYDIEKFKALLIKRRSNKL